MQQMHLRMFLSPDALGMFVCVPSFLPFSLPFLPPFPCPPPPLPTAGLPVVEEWWKEIKTYGRAFHMKLNFQYLPMYDFTCLLSPVQPHCHVLMWDSQCPYKYIHFEHSITCKYRNSACLSCKKCKSQCENNSGGDCSYLGTGGKPSQRMKIWETIYHHMWMQQESGLQLL